MFSKKVSSRSVMEEAQISVSHDDSMLVTSLNDCCVICRASGASNERDTALKEKKKIKLN